MLPVVALSAIPDQNLSKTAKSMKPMIILPPGLMSEPNIKALRDNGICVTVAKDPLKVRFLDPIPAASSRTQIENAAIALSRMLLNGQWSGKDYLQKTDISTLYMSCLMQGTPLDKNGTLEEQEALLISSARREEMVRIGKEEAREHRRAELAKQTAASKTT